MRIFNFLLISFVFFFGLFLDNFIRPVAASYCSSGEDEISIKNNQLCTNIHPDCRPVFTMTANICCCPSGVYVTPLPGCGSFCTGPTDQSCPGSCPCKLTQGGKTPKWTCGGIETSNCDICGCEYGTDQNTLTCPSCDQKCRSCFLPGATYEKGGAWTALGCIPTGDFSEFTAWLLKRIIGIAGGIAFLLVIFGGFKMMTSAGDPKGVQAAKETMTSALIGLLFIIFSVFLLELIGVKILGIPGL